MNPLKLRSIFQSCQLHASTMQNALMQLDQFDHPDWGNLTMEQRQILDQLAYRFGKLQDTLGMLLLPAICDLAGEAFPPNTPFAEKLQRLERLTVIPSVSEWKTLRETRNTLAHEYPDDPQLSAQLIQQFLTGTQHLLSIWQHIATHPLSQSLRPL
ncbi:hypothetical protein [Deefgea salmonis]|uniref:DUF86 domain-containing protein n=1 Tax=Deefgea salmonis TaxID=2875502 RepID=A0ABS8BK51_9NEIS|nr:hypothetical protein [Deefgea salmonis]MCB5196107.1 hypothetical protein [Deefgea salmonis]